MAEEEEEYYFPEEEYIPPKYPELERFKRQLLACSSAYMGALAAGICSTNMVHKFMNFKLDLGVDYEKTVFWEPLLGDAPGIVLAVPFLYFVGRRYTLLLTHLIFLTMLLVNEYFHEQQSTLQHYQRLPEELAVYFVLHGCVRFYVIVTIVYVAEVAQPSHRAPLIATFFPFFITGVLWGRFYFRPNRLLLAAIVAQTSALILAVGAPESPYWQAFRGKEEAAYETFKYLRVGDDDTDELAALLESAAPEAEQPPLAGAFGAALAKIVFLYMGTDSVCHVFMTHLTYPLHFFRYDNTYDHEVDVTMEPARAMYLYPIIGSLVFVAVCPFVGRRILYLSSILTTLLIFYVRHKHVTYDMNEMRVRSAEFCYFTSYLGATQVVFLLPAEIFPGKIRELGVAICELMQFALQYADFAWLKAGFQWSTYATIRLLFVPLGIILTFLFLPETKDISLIEAETEGAKFVPVILAAAKITEGLEPYEEVDEET